MGGSSSTKKKTPIPSYTPAGGSPGITRPGAPLNTGFNTGIGPSGPINRDQQRELMQLNQTVANLNNQVQALQRSTGMGIPQAPYGVYPSPGGIPPPMPYGTPPMLGQSPLGAAPSPFLQNLGGQYPYSYQQQPPMFGGGSGPAAVYRDTDFASIAHIAGLNPADVAILHREFMNLTRGGASKIDRVIFRQILRDVLLQANNEQVDRVIENMFVTIDRNRDGFIDFPEFVGAFKDVLKEKPSDPQNYFSEHVFPDMLGEQLRGSGVGAGIDIQPISYIQQAQPTAQLVSPGGLSIVPLASTAVQQLPIVYGGATHLQISDATAPLITLDPNQASYVIATPGQYLITQPTALQCVPLPIM
jgi:hypothetical protein